MIGRAARLALIIEGVRGIRHDLARELGSDKVSEIRLLDTLAESLDMLRQQSQRQRSSPSSVHRWSQP